MAWEHPIYFPIWPSIPPLFNIKVFKGTTFELPLVLQTSLMWIPTESFRSIDEWLDYISRVRPDVRGYMEYIDWLFCFDSLILEIFHGDSKLVFSKKYPASELATVNIRLTANETSAIKEAEYRYNLVGVFDKIVFPPDPPEYPDEWIVPEMKVNVMVGNLWVI